MTFTPHGRNTGLLWALFAALMGCFLGGCQTSTLMATVTPTLPSSTSSPAPTARSTKTPRPAEPLPSTYEGHLPEGAFSVLGLGKIISVDLSADGEYLAVLTGIGLGVYEARNLEMIWFEIVPAGGFTSSRIRWSPDGSRIAIAAPRDTIVWDAQGEEELIHLSLSYGAMYTSWNDVTWSPDSSLLAIWGSTEDILLCDAVTGRVRHQLPVQWPVLDVQWSPDSQWLAAKSETGQEVWNAISGESPVDTGTLPQFEWLEPEEVVTSLDNSTTIVVDAIRVMIQEVSNNSELETTHQIVGTYIGALGWSTDGNTLATNSSCVGGGTCFIIWDVRTGAPLDIQRSSTPPGYEFSREFLDTSPDGSRSLTYRTTGGSMTLWDTNSKQIIQELDAENECEFGCMGLTWSPDSKWLIAMMNPGLFIWDAHTGVLVKRIAPYSFGSFGNALALSPDGNLLATVVDGAVIVWKMP